MTHLIALPLSLLQELLPSSFEILKSCEKLLKNVAKEVKTGPKQAKTRSVGLGQQRAHVARRDVLLADLAKGAQQQGEMAPELLCAPFRIGFAMIFDDFQAFSSVFKGSSAVLSGISRAFSRSDSSSIDSLKLERLQGHVKVALRHVLTLPP